MSVPGGESSSTAVLDAAPTTDSALSASDAPVESTGDAEGVESQPADDGDSADSTTPDSDDESAEDVDDPADEGKTEDEKKLSRRERQKLREQERIDKVVAAKVAEREATDRAASEAKAAADKAAAAQQARISRLQKFIGVPDQPDKPGTLTTIQREIASIQDQIDSELTTPQGLDLDALLAQKREKQADHKRITENNAMSAEIENYVWDQISDDLFSAKDFPEFADDAARARYIHAPGGIRGAMQVLRQTIRSSVEAEWQAKQAAERKEAKAREDAMTSDRNAWRARAGGSEDAPMQGGTAANDGAMTLEKFRSLPLDQRKKLRETNAPLVDRLYAQSA